MSDFPSPDLCFPVESEDGFVIRVKGGADSNCFDFPLTQENAPVFLKAALETLAGEELELEDSDLQDLNNPRELRMAIIDQVNAYAESHGVPVDQFYEMCTALTLFVENGQFPQPTKTNLKRVK